MCKYACFAHGRNNDAVASHRMNERGPGFILWQQNPDYTPYSCHRMKMTVMAFILRPKKKDDPHESSLFSVGVRCGARTHDTQNHNLVLYQLN